MMNLSAVLYGKGDLRLIDCPIPEPGLGEVQLSMQNVSICGSDVHYWRNGSIGNFVVKAPMLLGHEGSGVVSKLGAGVTNLKIGDRVAVEPAVPCRMCNYCKSGRYNLCPDIKCCATPPYGGNLTQYYVHAADFCFKLPDHVTCEEGALLEPLSVGIHACHRAGVELGSKVLICGAGAIGIVSFLSARAMGASEICITDIEKSRLEFVKNLGVSHTLLVQTKDGKEIAKQVERLFGGRPDITIDCSGAPASIETALYVTRDGGCFVMVGFAPPVVEIPLLQALMREVDIRGIFRYVNCYPIALEMVASGKVDVKPLITHRYDLADSVKAFEHAHTMADGAIKVMIKCAK